MTLGSFFKSIPHSSTKATKVKNQTIPDDAGAATPNPDKRPSEPAKPSSENPGSESPTLYVSTNLQYRFLSDTKNLARDLMLNDVVYRRLDLQFYCWLRYKMSRLAQAYQRGELPEDRYISVLTPFMVVKAQALADYGDSEIQKAWKALLPKIDRYRPPSRKAFEDAGAVDRQRAWTSQSNETAASAFRFDWPESSHPDLPFRVAVTETALKKVRAKEKEAFAKGWSADDLYQNRGALAFPYGKEYGLICFLSKDQREIGDITEQAISIAVKTPHGQRIMRFKRPKP